MMFWLDWINNFFADREMPLWGNILIGALLFSFFAFTFWYELNKNRK